MKKILSVVLILIIFIACDANDSNSKMEEGEKDRSEKRMTASLPDSGGDPGEVVIIMNKKELDSEIGDAIRDVFEEYADGLLRKEPLFTIRVVEPYEFNRIFKIARNLVYVTSFEGNTAADKWLQNIYSESSRKMIFEDPSRFMQTSNNQYAKRQNVMQLFGKDDMTLVKNIRENKEVIQNFFNIAERKRLATDIKMTPDSRALLSEINKKLGFRIKIPAGYEMARLEDDFMWVRTLPPVGASKNLIVYFKDYEDQSEFEHQNVIKLRNEVGKKYVYGDPENPDSFMTTEEEYVYPVQRNIDFNEQFTVETRGAWKTNNLSVGGTFISYTFVDEGSNRLYYVEGFVIHPSENHRELIREMESLLTTFRAS